MLVKKILNWNFIFITLVLAVSSSYNALIAQETKRKIAIEDISESVKFRGKSFSMGQWAKEGAIISYTKFDREKGITNLMRLNFNSDEHELIVDGPTLIAPDVERVINIEDYEFNSDSTKILIYTDSAPVWRYNTKGFYYVFDIDNKELTPLSSRDKGYQMFAKFSPDGKHVGFVRNRNVFVLELETMNEIQLTNDGSEGAIINGTTDWAYEEELSLKDGWSWSPDSRHIAFYQFDESEVSEFMMLNQKGLKPELIKFKFPLVGEAVSEIHVGVIDVNTLETKFFETDTWKKESSDFEYIPRMGWTPQIDGGYFVWMLRLNRDQNYIDLVYGDPGSGNIKVILKEEEDTWVESFNYMSQDEKIAFLENGKHFVWQSESDGYNHLYVFTTDGKLVNQVTRGEWEVTKYHGYDEESGYVYFTATAESPVERHLYRTQLFQRDSPASAQKITEERGVHNINMSKDLRYFIDTHSDINTPRTTSLFDSEGDLIKVLENNEDLKNLIGEYNLSEFEIMTLAADDGTQLYAYMLKPSDFDPGKEYPLFMYTYGGPGVQTVQDSWSGFIGLWFHYLAEEHDIIIAGVDNRGSTGRGKKFASAIYKNLGTIEAQDQITAAKHFGELPFIDEDRIGIWGASYGGYNTALSMLKYDGPETIKLGIMVSPGVDFKIYDPIYTEKYMSTPEENPDGYEEADLSNFADRLRDDQHLLIIHSDLDDNAHFLGTLHFISALQKAKKQFSVMIYPGGDHSLRGTGNPFVYTHWLQLMTNFIADNL